VPRHDRYGRFPSQAIWSASSELLLRKFFSHSDQVLQIFHILRTDCLWKIRLAGRAFENQTTRQFKRLKLRLDCARANEDSTRNDLAGLLNCNHTNGIRMGLGPSFILGSVHSHFS